MDALTVPFTGSAKKQLPKTEAVFACLVALAREVRSVFYLVVAESTYWTPLSHKSIWKSLMAVNHYQRCRRNSAHKGFLFWSPLSWLSFFFFVLFLSSYGKFPVVIIFTRLRANRVGLSTGCRHVARCVLLFMCDIMTFSHLSLWRATHVRTCRRHAVKLVYVPPPPSVWKRDLWRK
jgi:hypothetical protein